MPTTSLSNLRLVICALALMACPALSAQDLGLDLGSEPGKLEIVGVQTSPSIAGAGDTIELAIRAHVADGYHVYGSKQDPNLGSPVEVLFADSDLFEVVSTTVPTGELHGDGEFASYWLGGDITLLAKVRLSEKASKKITISGDVGYSACTELACDPPTTTPFTLDFEVDRWSWASTPKGLSDPESQLEIAKVAFVETGETKRQLQVTVRVAEGYHAYGALESIGVPVELTAGGHRGVRALGVSDTPIGEEHEVPELGETQYYLEGEFVLTQDFEVLDEAALDGASMPARVAYMVCNDNGQCFPESALAFDVSLDSIEDATNSAAPPVGENPLELGLWKLILAGIGAGLFALVMPCTYPMIPVTFSFFSKQAEVQGRSLLSLALTYGIGVVTMFVLLGVAASSVIIPFATHPYTNIVIGSVFLYFALVLFGAVNFQPPSFLMNAAGNASRRGGLVGIFFMGLTLVISTFTCTAPAIGWILAAFSKSGTSFESVLKVVIVMATFGLTMAIPFVFLALAPGRLKAMPRSGEWMHAVKVTFGFVEVAAALKFFSNADMYWQTDALPRDLFLWLWAGIFLITSLFLLNVIKVEGESAERVGPARMSIALAFLLVAIYFGHGASGARLQPVLEGLLPDYDSHPRFMTASTPHGGGSTWTVEMDDLPAARATAEKDGKLLLISYTGRTCVNCRIVESTIFTQPDVNSMLEEHFVEVRIHQEYIKQNQPIADDIRENVLRSYAAPQYVIMRPEDVDERRVLAIHRLSGPQTSWKAGIKEFLSKGLVSAQKIPASPK